LLHACLPPQPSGGSSTKLYLSEPTLDDDGGFCGHTAGARAGNRSDARQRRTAREVYDANFKIVARYIPRRKFELGGQAILAQPDVGKGQIAKPELLEAARMLIVPTCTSP
jgi:hypothetical protein